MGVLVIVSPRNCPSLIVVFLSGCTLDNGGEKRVTVRVASLASYPVAEAPDWERFALSTGPGNVEG